MGIADAPWPKVACDLKNTNRSPYACTTDGTITKTVNLPDGDYSTTYGGGIVIGNNMLFLRNRAYNFDGTLKWESSADMGSFYKGYPVLASNGVLYHGADRWSAENRGYLHAIDTQSGNILKSSYFTGDLPRPQSLTITHDDVIVMPCQSDIYGFDLEGNQLWRKRYLDPPDSPSTTCVIGDDGVIYIGLTYRYPYETHSYVMALDPFTGSTIWSVNFYYKCIRTSLVMYGDNLYFLNDDGLCCVNIHEREPLLLSTDVTYISQGTNLAVSSTGTIYVPTYGGLFIYNAAHGYSDKWTGFEPDIVILDGDDNVYVSYYTQSDVFGLRAYNSVGEKLWDKQNFPVMAMAIGEGGTLYVIWEQSGYPDYAYSLCILGEAESFTCDPPDIITTDVKCAKPEIVFRAPTPEGDWRLHFRVQAYADENGAFKLDEVDSSVNPEHFRYSPDNGKTWRDFLADGLPPEQYGALVRARVDVGPRRKVWLRASVGA